MRSLTWRLLAAILPVCLRGAAAAGAAAETDQLLDKAEAAFTAWQYEEAQKAIDALVEVAPRDPRVTSVRLRFLLRCGTFGEAAEIGRAAVAPRGASLESIPNLPADDMLRTGRALLVENDLPSALTWILAGARRCGPDSPERYTDSLAAWAAKFGAPGSVSRRFAAQLAAPPAERAASAAAYRAVVAKIPAGAGNDAASAALVRYVASLREALLNGTPPPFPPPGLAAASFVPWSVPLGVDDLPEQFALSGGRLFIACQPAGQALPGKPLPAALLSVNTATGHPDWRFAVLPGPTGAPDGNADEAGRAALSTRIESLCVSGETVCLLAKTSQVREVGGSRQMIELCAEVVAVSAQSGRQSWRVPVDSRALRVHFGGGSIQVCGIRSVSCLSAADGRQLWTTPVTNTLGVSAITDKLVILPGLQFTQALDIGGGSPAWKSARQAGTGVVNQLLDAPGGRLVMISRGQGTYDIASIATVDGSIAWTKSFSDSLIAGPEIAWAVGGDRLLAVRGGLARTMALDNGTHSWQAVLPAPDGTAPAQLLGAGERCLWSAGHTAAVVDATSGRILSWAALDGVTATPLALIGAEPEPAVILVEGLGPRMITARRMRPAVGPADGAGREASREAAELLAIAAGLDGGIDGAAAACLQDIASGCAVPGSTDIEMALCRAEVKTARGSASLERRAPLLAAVAQQAEPENRNRLRAFLAGVLAEPECRSATACAAALALMLLGDDAGKEHLARNQAAWTGDPGTLTKVLTACRGAGAPAQSVLVAGLNSNDATARAAIAEQLAAYRGPGLAEALQARLTDPGRDVRAAAAQSLVAIAGAKAGPAIKEAYDREQDMFTRNRLRKLLASLGQTVERPIHRPPDHNPPVEPMPTPVKPPTIATAEQALAEAAKTGKVLWSKQDTVDTGLLWIATEKGFVQLYSKSEGRLIGFADFLTLVGRAEISAAAMAFGEDTAWAGTDKGAFVYDRRTKAWSQLVLNLDFSLLEASIADVELGKDGVVFRLKDGTRFEQDIKTKKWRKL